MSKPEISIVIPIYNDEKFLYQALDSVVRQTFQNIEIVCVNDGSKDGTVGILHEYVERDSRFTVIHHSENKGTLMARKTGVKAANGKYIMFLDADDCLAPDCCETVLELMNKELVDILWFSSEMLITYDDGSWVRSDLSPGTSYTVKIANPWTAVTAHDRTSLTTLFGKLYRSQLVKRAHEAMDDFYSIYGEDLYESFFILMYAESLIGYNTKPLMTYYKGRGITRYSNADLALFRHICRMNELSRRIRSFLTQEGLWEDIKTFWWNTSLRMACDCCMELYRLPVEDYPAAKKIFINAWDSCLPWCEVAWTLAIDYTRINNWSKELERAKDWLEGQTICKDSRIRELEAWTLEQDIAKQWFLEQIDLRDKKIAQLDGELTCKKEELAKCNAEITALNQALNTPWYKKKLNKQRQQ